MTAACLEELAVWAETEANALDYEGSAKASSRLRDLARCAREAVLLRRVAVRAYMLLARLKEQKPQPPQSMMVKTARKQLQTAIEAVEAAEGTNANKG